MNTTALERPKEGSLGLGQWGKKARRGSCTSFGSERKGRKKQVHRSEGGKRKMRGWEKKRAARRDGGRHAFKKQNITQGGGTAFCMFKSKNTEKRSGAGQCAREFKVKTRGTITVGSSLQAHHNKRRGGVTSHKMQIAARLTERRRRGSTPKRGRHCWDGKIRGNRRRNRNEPSVRCR